MSNAKLKESWEPLVDKLIFAVWQGKEDQAAKALLPLQTALRQAQDKKLLDSNLLDALYRLADFYCFERRFDECLYLFAAVHRAQTHALLSTSELAKFSKFRTKLETLKQLSDQQKITFGEGASLCAKISEVW